MSKFTLTKTKLKDVYIIEPTVCGDNRGYFMETYNKKDFESMGLYYDFVQDNQSSSQKGVLRGLHFQEKHPQTKLVRVLKGEVFDVAVDLRANSSTYGDWVGVLLSEENKKQLLIPKGFAHGFLVVSEYAEFAYKCDDFYHPEDEKGIIWNDPTLAINWPKLDEIILSPKDENHSLFTHNTFNFVNIS